MGLGIAADAGGGIIGVQQRAAGRHDLDRPETAGILRDRRIGEMQDGVVGRRPSDREHGIDRAFRLTVGAAVIDHHFLALHIHVDVNLVGFGLDAVIFHIVFEAIFAVANVA